MQTFTTRMKDVSVPVATVGASVQVSACGNGSLKIGQTKEEIKRSYTQL